MNYTLEALAGTVHDKEYLARLLRGSGGGAPSEKITLCVTAK